MSGITSAGSAARGAPVALCRGTNDEEEMRRVCVVGGGAIGSLFAAHLAQVAEVSILTRRPAQAAAILAGGLHISGKAELVSWPRATASPEELPACDLVVLATKATDLESAMGGLAGRCLDAVMMTTQNGLGAEGIVLRHGDWPVISGVTFMSGNRRDDTHVEYELDAPTWFGAGSLAPASPRAIAQVERLLLGSGLKAEAMPDILPAQWSKLIFNATVNGVAALTGLPHDRHFSARSELSDLGYLIEGLIDEGRRVAAAKGIVLYEDPWEMNVHAVARGETGAGDYRHLPSMLEDVLAKRPTEVDFITGALVTAGLEVGVDTPLHLAIYRLVKGKEASFRRTPWRKPTEAGTAGQGGRTARCPEAG